MFYLCLSTLQPHGPPPRPHLSHPLLKTRAKQPQTDCQARKLEHQIHSRKRAGSTTKRHKWTAKSNRRSAEPFRLVQSVPRNWKRSTIWESLRLRSMDLELGPRYPFKAFKGPSIRSPLTRAPLVQLPHLLGTLLVGLGHLFVLLLRGVGIRRPVHVLPGSHPGGPTKHAGSSLIHPS